MKQVLILTLGLITTSLLTFAVFALTRRRKSPSAMSLGLLIAALTLYSGSYIGELLSTTLGGMLRWNRLEYIGISFLPAFWILFCAQYVNARWVSSRQAKAVLVAISFVTLFGALTDPVFHLRYASVFVRADGPFPILGFTRGPIYWWHIIYTVIGFAIGTILLFRSLFSTGQGFFRKQQFFMLAGSCLPWTNYILYLSGIPSWPIDTVPFSMFLAIVCFGTAILGYRILDVAPVARNLVFETMSDGAIVLDPSGRIVDFNAVAAGIFPALTKEILSSPIERACADCPELLIRVNGDNESEFQITQESGNGRRYFHCRISYITSRTAAAIGKLILLKDNTDSTLLMEKLQELATIDPLTRVFNRRHLLDFAMKRIEFHARVGRPLTILMIDLDYFKNVNDNWGHLAGDEVLKTIAKTLSNGLRACDFIGRYGGEEFVCVLSETFGEDALEAAERLRESIRKLSIPISGNREISITASFGLYGVERPGKDDTIDEYVERADAALYAAKTRGRNRTVVYEEGMLTPGPYGDLPTDTAPTAGLSRA
jgi:diguanylate cyclase (GGDEF)-like protein